MKAWKKILALTLAFCMAVPSVNVSAASDVTDIETQTGKEISLEVGAEAYTETIVTDAAADLSLLNTDNIDRAVANVSLEIVEAEVTVPVYDHQTATNVFANAFSTTANADLSLEDLEFVFTKSETTEGSWQISNKDKTVYLCNEKGATNFFKATAADTTMNPVDGGFEIINNGRYAIFHAQNMQFDANSSRVENADCKNTFTLLKKQDKISAEDAVPGYQIATEIEDGGIYLLTYKTEDDRYVALYAAAAGAGQSARTKLIGIPEYETTYKLEVTPEGNGTTSIIVDGVTYTITVSGGEPQQPADTAFKSAQTLVDEIKEGAALSEVYFGEDQVFDGTKTVDASAYAEGVKAVNSGSIILRFKAESNTNAGVLLSTKADSLALTSVSQLYNGKLDRTAFYMEAGTSSFRFVYPHTWAGWKVSVTDGYWHTIVLSSLSSGKYMRLTIDGTEVWSNTSASNGGMFGKQTSLDQVYIGGLLNADGTTSFGFKGEISHVIVTGEEISDADAIKISKAGCTVPVTSGSAISQMFTGEVADTSWVFTGGADVKGGFEQTRGERNYPAMFEKYDRGGSSGSFSVNRQRFVVNAGKDGQTLSDVVTTYETRIAAYAPKAAVYLVGSDDWKKGDDGLSQFKTDLTSFIEKSLDLRADDQGFAVIQKPFAVNNTEDNAMIEKYCAAVDEVLEAYEAEEAKFERIFVVDHYTATKDNETFLADGIDADGRLTADGHMVIGRQFTVAVAKCTESAFDSANAVTSMTEVKMPEEYLDVTPTVTATADTLEVVIPEGNGTAWNYELDMDGTIVSGTADSNSFTISGLAAGKSYVLKIQSQDGTKQLTTTKGTIAAGVTAVENILQTSEMNKYQKEIAEKISGDEPLTWLFMGDSITHATTTYGYDGVVQVVEDFVANELGRKDDIVVNAGVNNATTEHTLEQIQYRLVNYTPDILAIQLGTNDAIYFDDLADGATGNAMGQGYQSGVVAKGYKDKFEKYQVEMQAIIDKAKEINPDVTIILRSPTPSLDGRHVGNRAVDLYVAEMKALAEKNDCMFIDQYTDIQGEVTAYSWMRTMNNTFFFTDSLHPGTNGHRIMAYWFIKACGLWTEDSAITNLLYEMPMTNTKNSYVPAVTVDRTAASISVDTAALEAGSSTDLGQIVLTAVSKTTGQSYETSVKDGVASVVLADLPKETYEVTVAGYVKSAAQCVQFAAQEVTLGDVRTIELSVNGEAHTEAVTADTVVGIVGNEAIATVEKVSATVQKVPLHDHKTATGTISAAFDTAVNNAVSLEDAEFIFTAADGENQWQVSNKDKSVYLNNATSGPENFFKSAPADVTMQPVDGGFRIITGSRIAIFHYTNSRFDANSAYSANSAWTHEFTLLEKQETVSEDDVVPGYKAATAIEEGRIYLITYISPDDEVIVLYPANGANQGTRTKLVGTPVTTTTYELVITPKAEGTTSVTVDGVTYTIVVGDGETTDPENPDKPVVTPGGEADENINVVTSELLKAGSINVSEENVTAEQPFPQYVADSKNFRIPALITLENGDLLAAADARWTTTFDSRGLDTIASVSSDNGQTWYYSLPIYFPDSSTTSPNLYDGTTVIDPALVQGPDGAIYCIADVNPSGVTTQAIWPSNGTGYVEIEGKERLVLTDTYVQPSSKTWSTYGDPSDAETYEYYVGDYNSNGYAKVFKRADNTATDWVIDEWFNLYKLNAEGNYVALTQTQVNSDTEIQQNVFYKDSELHVFSTGYILYAKSYDNGRTWEDPTVITTQIKAENETALLVSPGQGMVTSGGDIIIPFYTNTVIGTSEPERASIIWSSDNGTTWQRSNNVSGVWSSESEVVEINDGVLRIFFRNGTGTICYADITKENGVWTIGTGTSTGVSVTSTCNVTAIRYSEEVNGKIAVIVGCPSNGGSRADGSLFTFLVDENNDMELYYEYEFNKGYYAYSCMTELTNGNIGLLWEDSWGGNYDGTIRYDEVDIDLAFGKIKNISLPAGQSYTEENAEGKAYEVQDGYDKDVVSVATEKVNLGNITLLRDHDGTAVQGSVAESFNAASNPNLNLEDAVFTMQASGEYWNIYNESTGMYLTNNASANTFFETTAREMIVENIDGEFQIRKSNDTRPVFFYLPGMNFNANGAYTPGDEYQLVLLEKQSAISDDDVVPGYTRAATVEDGKQYLITYLLGDDVIVLYPTNGTNNQTKVVGSTEYVTKNVLTITALKKGTTTVVVNDVEYNMTVTSAEIPVEKLTASTGSAHSGQDGDKTLDDSTSTLWHTEWQMGHGREDHWISFAIDGDYLVDGLKYLPRQDGNTNGVITEYQIEISEDGTTWTTVATGEWEANNTWKTVEFAPVSAKYVKLTSINATSGETDNDYASAAEIRLTGSAVTAPVEPPVEECKHTTTKVVNAKEATCTEEGYTGDTVCTICDETVETGSEIAKKAHTEVTVAGKEATCTETGLTEGKKCSVCGTVTVVQEVIAKKAHTEVTVAGKEATCTEAGLTEGKKCSVCDTVTVKQETVPAAGHTWSEWTVVKEATTEEAGSKERTCSVCGEKETEEIPKLEPETPEPDTAAPTAPTELKTTVVEKTVIKLSWEASEDNKGVAGYAIILDGKEIGTVTGTAAEISQLEAGKTYTITVKAYDEAGNYSDAAAEIKVTTKADEKTDNNTSQPTQPTAPSAPATGDTAAIFTWIAVAFVMAAGACTAFFRRRKIK